MVERRTIPGRGDLLVAMRTSLVTTALFLSGFILPIGGPVVMALTPQPGLRLWHTDRERVMPLVVVLAAAMTGLAGGIGPALFYLVSFGLFTIVLPPLLRREWSIEVTLGVATAAVAATMLFALLCSESPTDLWIAMRTGLEQVRDQAVHVYGTLGLSPDVARQLEEGSAGAIDMILRLGPALFVVSIAAVGLVNVDFLRRSERARGLVPIFGDLTRWKCPAELVWVLIASGYATFVFNGAVESLAANVFAVLLVVYFFQGLVIAQFYMRRWHSPLWVVGLVYFFVAVQYLFATAVTLLGVFDLWADFRRLNPRPVEED